MYVDGKPVILEAAPIILNSRTLLPIRAVVEAVGGEIVTKTSRIFLTVLLVFSLLVSSLGGRLPRASAVAFADDGFIISEYLEGSSYNKAIELYNGTSLAIDLAQYKAV